MHGRLGQPSSQSAPALGTPPAQAQMAARRPREPYHLLRSFYVPCVDPSVPRPSVRRRLGTSRESPHTVAATGPVLVVHSTSIAAGVTMTGRSASRVSHQTPVHTLFWRPRRHPSRRTRGVNLRPAICKAPLPLPFRRPPTKCHDVESAVVGDCAAFPLMRSVMRQPRFAFASPPGEKSSPHQTSSSGCHVPPNSDAPTLRAPMASRNRHDDTHTWPRAGGEQPRCVTKRVF